MNAVDFIKDWAQLIVVVLAAGGALLTLWRKVARPMGAMKEVVDLQLTENGGGSLIDKVNKIAPNHTEARGHWEELKASQVEIKQNSIDIAEALKKDNAEIADALKKENATIAARLEARSLVADERLDKIEQAMAGVGAVLQKEKAEIMKRLDKLEQHLP